MVQELLDTVRLHYTVDPNEVCLLLYLKTDSLLLFVIWSFSSKSDVTSLHCVHRTQMLEENRKNTKKLFFTFFSNVAFQKNHEIAQGRVFPAPGWGCLTIRCDKIQDFFLDLKYSDNGHKDLREQL